MNFPTFESFANASQFFVDVENEDGETGKMRISLRRATIVISVPCLNGKVSKVAFMKTNRSKTYRDSRTPKQRMTATEVKAEIHRMLQDTYLAEEAFRALQV